MSEKKLKTCAKGHKFYKSSNCPPARFVLRQISRKVAFYRSLVGLLVVLWNMLVFLP